MSATFDDVEAMQRGKYVWAENLTSAQSRFSHKATGLTFQWEPAGYAGSLIEVPERVANDPYFRRAVARGKLGLLDEAEAMARMEGLAIREDEAAERANQAVMDSLSKGAGERLGSRYVKEGLSEYGEQKGQIPAAKVWGEPEREAAPERPAAERAPAGLDEEGRGVAPSPTDMDAPLPPEAVLTEPVRRAEG